MTRRTRTPNVCSFFVKLQRTMMPSQDFVCGRVRPPQSRILPTWLALKSVGWPMWHLNWRRVRGDVMKTSLRSLARAAIAGATMNVVALTAQAGPAGALDITLKNAAAADRIERQRDAAAGQLPLPNTPRLGHLEKRLARKGLAVGQPVLIRIFKAESELEVWMEKNGRFIHFATYPICQWSGKLGPKLAEGDKQSPEGFYTVTRRQLHRTGRWPRSLNLGFPNAFDRSQARTGSYILVHGGCSSVGCYAMTNAVMEEIYTLTKSALDDGQKHVPVHVFPFHLTNSNLHKYRKHKWVAFWRDLKSGYDAFNRTRRAPLINVCQGRYAATPVPPLEEGGSGGPFSVCAQTANVLRAFDQLDRIARRPSLWRKLSNADRTFLIDTAGPKRVAAARKGRGPTRTASHLKHGINKQTKRRVTCDRRKASCKRFLAMKARKRRSAARKRARRIRTASPRRR